MRRRRQVLGLVVLAVVLAGTTAPAVWAALQTSSGTYLGGPFSNSTANTFVNDLARVGVGVYATGASSPLRPVRAPVSPLRLTADQARAAALGVWAHAGVSGAALDGLTPPVRLGLKVRVRIGVLVAGWAKQAQTPSAVLARRILGKTDWSHYRSVVFPQAVLLLFASDVAVHTGGKTHGLRTVSSTHQSAGICTAVTGFVDQTLDAVFKAIGHLSIPAPSGTGFFATIIRGAAAVGEFVVNTAIDIAHFVVVNGVKVAIGAIIAPIAAVAGTVAAISQVATFLLPWTGTVVGKPNPVSKGVGAGEAGIFSLTVTAPGSTLEWPSVIVDCAQAFNIPLPSLVPTDADVQWNLGQNPGGLIVRGTDSGSLDKNGTAILQFETTTEPPDLASKGVQKSGAVAAIVSVHRKDLDQLGDQISQALLAPLPSIVQSTLGPALQSLLKPLLDSAKAKIAAVRDIQATGTETVLYHEPRPQTPPPQPQPQPPPGTSTGDCTAANVTTKFHFRAHLTEFVSSSVSGSGPVTDEYRAQNGKTVPGILDALGCSDATGSAWVTTYPDLEKVLQLFHGSPTFPLPAPGASEQLVDTTSPGPIQSSDTVRTTRLTVRVSRGGTRTFTFEVRVYYDEQSLPGDPNPYHGSGYVQYDYTGPIMPTS